MLKAVRKAELLIRTGKATALQVVCDNGYVPLPFTLYAVIVAASEPIAHPGA